MTEEEKGKLKERIEKRILQTREDIRDLEELTRPIAPENAIGRVSRMDAINNKSVNEAALRTARKKLEGLQYSLGKFGTADFGICTACKKEIAFGRLWVMPESMKCVKCASKRG